MIRDRFAIVIRAAKSTNRKQNIFHKDQLHRVCRMAAKFKTQIKKPAASIGWAYIRDSRTDRTPATRGGWTVDRYGRDAKDRAQVHDARIHAYQYLSVHEGAGNLPEAIPAD
jgi:hypothetical protein